ncbi:MAG TPA: matrixin family metalloprotease [Planctomycetota bacterium]|nr:matrixin family metalloprotease [Planctomycetota bacterium]
MKRSPGLALAAALLVVPALAQEKRTLAVVNLHAGETLRHPIALLRGQNARGERVSVRNTSNPGPDGACEVATRDGRFKALVELVKGENALEIASGGQTERLQLRYEPATTPFVVRAIYVTAQDGKTDYLTPLENDRQDYRDKLDTALKLMQTFTAESLADAGFGRRTFRLELDEQGKVVVHVVKYPKKGDDLRAQDGDTLYRTFSPWLEESFPTGRAKNVAVMAFTGYDPVKKKATGHTALGGGGLGLFSSNGMCAWPSRIADVERAFTDTTPVDDKVLWDDSNGRSVFWGLAATTIGATLHEMGHTLGLAHSPDPESVMSRGFDHLNRFFTVEEPPSKNARAAYAFKETEVTRWDPPFAGRLAGSPWLAADETSRRSPIRLVEDETGALVASSTAGIRLVEAATWSEGSMDPPAGKPRGLRQWLEAKPPASVSLSLADLRSLAHAREGEPVYVTFFDAAGGRVTWCDAGRTDGLDDDFGDGWRGFKWGMSPEEANAHLDTKKDGVSWATMPIASEFKTDEVRYFWVRFSDVGEVEEAKVQGNRVGSASYVCFLFRDKKLVRVSLRFQNGLDVRDHRFVLDAFLEKHHGKAVSTHRDERCVFVGKKVVVAARCNEEGTKIELAPRGEAVPEDQDW